MQTVFIPGQLPGMNDLIEAAKGAGGRGYRYSALKKTWTAAVVNICQRDGLQPVERARFTFLWQEAKRHRDPDNIAGGGRKLILDGLVAAGVLPGDGWSAVLGWTDAFEVSSKPGVLVGIESA